MNESLPGPDYRMHQQCQMDCVQPAFHKAARLTPTNQRKNLQNATTQFKISSIEW